MTTLARRSKGLVKRTTIEIPVSLYSKLLKHTLQTGLSINQTVFSWIEGPLQSLPDPPIGEIQRFQKTRRTAADYAGTSRRTS